MDSDDARHIETAAARAARASDAPLLLAVSGGLDSMVMLHAMERVARARIAGVATIDHGTGPAAASTAREVSETAQAMGLPVYRSRMAPVDPRGGRESAWRTGRYEFLRATAKQIGARIATAHTMDDQIETVLMRVLRGSGARGLAALYAPSDIMRPFLALERASLERYAGPRGITWREDPSNASREHFRNRIRLDLLPALRAADPSLPSSLLELSRRAAAWRADVDVLVEGSLRVRKRGDERLEVGAQELSALDGNSLCVVWAALAARVGLALDRRGTRRLAEFTRSQPRRGSVPLSGGWIAEATNGWYVLRRATVPPVAALLPEAGSLAWGSFRFRRISLDDGASSWAASLPAGAPLLVRSWSPGDRMTCAASRPPRRVKRYLSDAGLRGLERSEWPVVVAGDDIVWIPGVRRSIAATVRSGRPERHYVCERIDR